ncbi:MAG: hypothetical protein ACMVY4_04070 [Minwuia sp.]|uniref:hypothetical protein n=1 Tax=Minwuia sp. TaxID=2493630 RepID=UPI003A88319D
MDQNLSVDRLGVRKPDCKVLEYLDPICKDHEARLNAGLEGKARTFHGWAQINVSELRRNSIEIQSSPDEENNNPYHADIVRGIEKRFAQWLAFILRELAQQNELVLRPSPRQDV